MRMWRGDMGELENWLRENRLIKNAVGDRRNRSIRYTRPPEQVNSVKLVLNRYHVDRKEVGKEIINERRLTRMR